jgi:hypothetical protein
MGVRLAKARRLERGRFVTSNYMPRTLKPDVILKVNA